MVFSQNACIMWLQKYWPYTLIFISYWRGISKYYDWNVLNPHLFSKSYKRARGFCEIFWPPTSDFHNLFEILWLQNIVLPSDFHIILYRDLELLSLLNFDPLWFSYPLWEFFLKHWTPDFHILLEKGGGLKVLWLQIFKPK